MIVYVYDVKTNEKKLSNKHVTAIVSTPKAFIITDSDGTTVRRWLIKSTLSWLCMVSKIGSGCVWKQAQPGTIFI